MTKHPPPRLSARHLFVALAALVLALAFGSAPVTAQSPSLSGTWRLQGDPAAAQAAIQQSVEPAIRTLAPDLQRLARARIAETTWVPSTITITATPARISVAYAGEENRTFDTAPGQPQNVYSRSGVRAQLTQTYLPNGGIQQQFVALDGQQFNVLMPDPSGRLLYLDVTMRSPRFSQEIRFRLVYQRG
ncbi:MAG TPA: hypothetical protein VIL20_22830 [Sandaracinaceae bacterium]